MIVKFLVGTLIKIIKKNIYRIQLYILYFAQ